MTTDKINEAIAYVRQERWDAASEWTQAGRVLAREVERLRNGPLERLEAWRNGHKSRSVQVHIDDGYGATCWLVTLTQGTRRVIASEVFFLKAPHDAKRVEKGQDLFCAVCSEASFDDWPGLVAVIELALLVAETWLALPEKPKGGE